MQFSERLSCRVEVYGNRVHLIVCGELDHHTSDGVDLAVRSMLTGRPEVLVLDLSAVKSASVDGAAALVDTVHRAASICAAVVVLPSFAIRQRLATLSLTQAPLPGDADEDTGRRSA
jgi:anti-anti-sigma regulatory factor